MDLSERKERILRAVIEDYIETAEPVGSKSIAASAGLDVSPATIRSEMAELEALGLLEQPHTSAGRVPSPKGYRIYVNHLMHNYRLSVQETQRLNEALHLKLRELDDVLGEAGRIVSQLTQYPSFALASRAARVTIVRFDLILVAQDSFIIVVMTDTNLVRNRLVRLPTGLTSDQLHLLTTLLNATFTGLTADEITPELMRLASHAAGEAYGLISVVVAFAMEVLESLSQRTVHTAGVASLFSHPEYQSLERAGPLMAYLSEASDPAQFPAPHEGRTEILIGPENVVSALQNTSVVMASYDIGGGMRGVIGVVGPTRMDYAKISARLSYFAEGLAQRFGRDEFSGPQRKKTEDETI